MDDQIRTLHALYGRCKFEIITLIESGQKVQVHRCWMCGFEVCRTTWPRYSIKQLRSPVRAG